MSPRQRRSSGGTSYRMFVVYQAIKSYAVTMVIIDLLAVVYLFAAPHASAQPLCEHRSAQHAAKSHTTREGDSRWHVAHGQLPTCNLDQSDDHDDQPSHDDGGPTIHHRDHPGFHCGLRGCG